MSSVSHRPSIKVDSSSIQDLKAFLADNAGDGKKLYAKKDANNETILYVKQGSNFLDKLRPGADFFFMRNSRAHDKQELARTSLSEILVKAGNAARDGATATGATGIDRMLSNIGYTNDNWSVPHWNRDSQAVLKAVKGLESFLESVPKREYGPEPKPGFNPPTGSNILDTHKVVGELSGAQRNDLVKLADHLGAKITQNYRNAEPSARADLAVAIADKDAFKATLKQELQSSPVHGAAFRSDPTIDGLVEAVYQSVARETKCAIIEPGGMTQIKNDAGKSFDAPTIRVGDKVYQPDKFLAQGGFGATFAYKSATGDELVVKLPILPNDADADELGAAARETGGELRNFARIGEGDHDNIVGFKGGCRMPNGAYAIVMDMAPNGNVHDIGLKMGEDVASGTLTDAEALAVRKTLIRDMAEGMAHMHEASGSTHYDFKPPNCMIGADGRAKIMDFGTSFEDATKSIRDAHEIDNPAWKAPEILFGERVHPKELKEAQVAGAEQELGDLIALSGKKGEEAKKLAKDVGSQTFGDTARKTSDYKTNQKVDVWSLGMSALDMLRGGKNHLGEASGFMSAQEDILLKFKGEGGNAIDGTPTSFAPSTRDVWMDKFVNRILVADPAQRPSASAIASDPVLNDKSVGLPGTRDLIKALAMPNGGSQAQRLAQLDQQIAKLDTEASAKSKAYADSIGSSEEDANEQAYNEVLDRTRPLIQERDTLRNKRDADIAARNSAITSAKAKFAADLAAA